MLESGFIPFAKYASKSTKPANKFQGHNLGGQGNQRRNEVICQFCEKPLNKVKQCFKITNRHQPSSNYASNSNKKSTWLLDSASTHHVTSYMNKLKEHNEYDDTDSLTIGDRSHLPISH